MSNQEKNIQQFWHGNPCGDMLVGGLKSYTDYESFFKAYDDFRYQQLSHILEIFDELKLQGKKTLEIGLGQGADSEQIIKRGAIWSGVDLTEESIARVSKRLDIRKLPYHAIKQGSVLELPFEDNSFDVIYSCGVLHHVPDIQQAQKEISRVLKPDGELVVMLYAKWSLNYLLAISVLRRLGLVMLYLFNPKISGIYGEHLANAHKEGLWNYLKMGSFIHRNTDGPHNPYSKVYDSSIVEQDFSDFEITRSYKRFMWAPPLPVGWLPLEKILGWALWVHMKPKSKVS